MSLLDSARPVRPGEELDTARLGPYLQQALGLASPDLAVEQFPGGHSNLTYLIRAGARELVLRRPPFGSTVRTAHDMGREVRVLTKLSALHPWAPRPLAHCEDPAVLGAPFYVMERLRGLILRRQIPPEMVLTPPAAQRLCENFIDTLADLHNIDYRAAGLGDFGKPDHYVRRQVEGWTQRYDRSKTDSIPEIAEIAAWLASNLPDAQRASILHNDYKYDNLVLDAGDPTRIIGILDWEMSTLGDPLMDLGTALCYWVDADDPDPVKMMAFGPTYAPGSLNRRGLAERYAARTGLDLSNRLFYYVFGLFKTAVVIQQIYYRYHQGHTKDERFANLIFGVRILVGQAMRSLDRGGF